MFELTIALGNDAFAEDWQSEVSRILRDCADRLDSHGASDPAGGTLMDINGNSVGLWRVNA